MCTLRSFAALFIGFCLVPAISFAASFDCVKAASPFEKTVCSDPEISKLDEDLAAAYGNALKALSKEGKQILRDGQRRWLHFVNDVCLKDKNGTGTSSCMREVYEKRVNDLKTAAVRIGPFLFSRIDYFFPNKDDKFDQGQTSYPRIDNPSSAAVKKWNNIMAAYPDTDIRVPKPEAEGEEAYCEIGRNFVIRSATATVISAEITDSMYCHRTPHGYSSTEDKIYILTPDVHLLTETDLFSSDTGWKDFLTQRCYDAFAESNAEGVIDRQIVEYVVTDPRTWSLTNDGLIITTSHNDLCGACGSFETTISWSDLKPFLNPRALRYPINLKVVH
jgi:uncharacterized protein